MADAAAASAHHSDDEEVTPGYVAPAKKTVEEIAELDKDDEALVKYKQALLGDAVGQTGAPLKVTVMSMSFETAGRDPIVMDLTGDLSKLKESSVVIKEGCEYQLNFTFGVEGEIVSGLRFHQNITRKGIPVSKLNLMLGSFGPRVEPHTFKTPTDEAPKGALARGTYHAKCKFIDDDKSIHLAWEWAFKIQSDW